MIICCTAYISQRSRLISDCEMAELFLIANDRNLSRDLTGFLYLSNDRFFQYLEGPKYKLERTMECIRNDERHIIIREFALPPLYQSRFSDWRMRRFDYSSEESILLDAPLIHEEVNPLDRLNPEKLEKALQKTVIQTCDAMAERDASLQSPADIVDFETAVRAGRHPVAKRA